MASLRLPTRAFWITLLDAVLIVAVCAGCAIALGGRTRLLVDGRLVSLRSPVNFLIASGIFGALRIWLGRGLRPLPAVPRGDFSLIEAERLRFAVPAHAGRDVWICAALTLAGSLIWIAPHIWHLRAVPDRGDPFYSAWSLARIVHQFVTDPRHLFDGNIFYPVPRTLTYSDPRFLEAFLGAPFLLAGVDPLIVSNALMLLAFPACGLATFYAAWRLTGDPRAALVAGLLGAWYPFHAEHYSHLELNWLMFVPLAAIAGLRLLAAPDRRRGLVFGSLVAAQWFASMYVGVMLMTFLVPFLLVAALAWRVRPTRQLMVAALAAALVLGPALALLGYPYLQSTVVHGERRLQEVADGSAVPTDYGATHKRLSNYAWHSRVGNRGERELFPGTSTLALAGVGLIPPMTGATIAAVVSGAVAFDWSLGLNGLTYKDLYTYAVVYRGMRVPARFTVVIGAALAMLGAFGAHRLIRLGRSPRAQAAICGALAVTVLWDLRIDPGIQMYTAPIPSIYARVDSSMVLGEMPEAGDIDYMYFSTRHWAHLLSGYSGFFPFNPDLDRAKAEFPSPEGVALFHSLGATHLTYNCAFETSPGRCHANQAVLDENRTLELVASEQWEGGEVRLYRFK